MEFIAKLKNLIEICNTTSNRIILKIFKTDNELECESIYLQNTEYYNTVIHDNILPAEYLLNNLYLNNKDFLKGNNDKVINYIEYAIYMSNDPPGSIFQSYDNWKGKKYSVKDFTVDDMLQYMKIITNPPLPLEKKYIKKRKEIINKLFTESLYKSYNSLNSLFQNVMNNENLGDFKLTCEDTTYYIHSFIIKEYEFFDNIIKSGGDSFKVDTTLEVTKLFIEFLYTKKFSYDNDHIDKLNILAKYTNISELIQICDLILC